MTNDQDPKTPATASPRKRLGGVVDLIVGLDQVKEQASAISDQRQAARLEQKILAKSALNTGLLHSDSSASTTNFSQIVELDPARIRPWAFADRPAEEYGDINELMASIQATGQIQPITVRAVHNNSSYDYELIAGARRHRACELAKCNVKAIIRDIDDRTAFLMMREENDKRSGLSPWANALAYKKAIDQEIYSSESDLARHLGCSQQAVSQLMCFFRIPQPLFDAISSFSNVSIRTVKAILALLNKHPSCISVLLDHADKIRAGQFSPLQIQSLSVTKKDELQTFSTSSGHDAVTIRSDSNGTPVISLLKAARVLDPHDVAQVIVRMVEEKEREMLESSAGGM